MKDINRYLNELIDKKDNEPPRRAIGFKPDGF